uniref:Uncharacterized protein n=1 Tax=Romanomermis culicivorax TaxID=13658 RepID=A0A915KY77_ROMCU
GRTNANDNKIIQGHAPEPLNDIGRKEVDLLTKRLSKIEFTNVFSSDLVRAKETTEILIESIDFDKKDVIYDERLRERKFGILEGQSIKLRTKLAAEAKQPILAYTPQGGETFGCLQDRAAKIFEFIREKLYKEIYDSGKACRKLTYVNLADVKLSDDFAQLLPDEVDARALLVTHGGLIRELLRYLLDKYRLKYAADPSLDRSGVLKLSCNTALTEVLIFSGGNMHNRDVNKALMVQSIVCPVLNSISHLKAVNRSKTMDFDELGSGV